MIKSKVAFGIGSENIEAIEAIYHDSSLNRRHMNLFQKHQFR